jgi:two-component system OmpR family sensor kinase
MGRLFWKFFLFIWLAQLAGALGTGLFFWLDRERFAARIEAGPAREFPPRPFPADHHRPPPPAHDFRPPPLPVLLGSLFCAAGLAWYIAKPIRQLRGAFEAAAAGTLEVRVGASMGKRRDELADLGHDFDRMSRHLRALMDGQRRLLHDVSHELRSPLARLHAAIGLARQQPARLEDSLQRIEREGERMNRLVGELLTLSRLEAGVGAPLEEVYLVELIGDLVEDARFEAASRSVTVNCETLPNIQVRANGELLQRAIENVLRNALRFSPVGGLVSVVVSAGASDCCQIVIDDQGPGVPPAELESIFTPFFRGGGAGEGYGLGLAIARRVLAAVNGKIHAENRPEGGLRVVLEMPGQPMRPD